MTTVNKMPHEAARASCALLEQLPPPLPATGFLRLYNIIGRPPTENRPGIAALVPVSATTFWKWVREGKAPKPCRLPGNVTAWRVEEIRDWMQSQRGGNG
jgi:predicted DNA-binding transcriptional regulator AlpA